MGQLIAFRPETGGLIEINTSFCFEAGATVATILIPVARHPRDASNSVVIAIR
jgi:hypothetical protein